VVAITFLYTACPLPDYCFRLSNNFARLRQRFGANPVHDTPPVLARYAATWKADPQTWHFLTGSLDEVKTVSHRFGLNFWQEEGFLRTRSTLS
jgi:protein SCO1